MYKKILFGLLFFSIATLKISAMHNDIASSLNRLTANIAQLTKAIVGPTTKPPYVPLQKFQRQPIQPSTSSATSAPQHTGATVNQLNPGYLFGKDPKNGQFFRDQTKNNAFIKFDYLQGQKMLAHYCGNILYDPKTVPNGNFWPDGSGMEWIPVTQQTPEEFFRTNMVWNNGILQRWDSAKQAGWVQKWKPRAAIFQRGSKSGFYTPARLDAVIGQSKQPLGIPKFRILIYDPQQWYKTHIMYLQAAPENYGAVFQLASTFFGPLEGGMVNQDSLLEGMKGAPVQGEMASIGTIGATLYTKYFMPTANATLPPNNPQKPRPWPLTATPGGPDRMYVNNYFYLLQDLADQRGNHKVPLFWSSRDRGPTISTTPGQGSFFVINPKFDVANDYKNVGIYFKEDIVVSWGINEKGQEIELMHTVKSDQTVDTDAAQIVSQVLAAAVNFRDIQLNDQAYGKLEELAKIVLKGSYIATLKAAYYAQKPKIFLTFVGGGSFRNDPTWLAPVMTEIAPLIRQYGLDVSFVFLPDLKSWDTTRQGRDARRDTDLLQALVRAKDAVENTKYSQTLTAAIPVYLNAWYQSNNINALNDPQFINRISQHAQPLNVLSQ